MKFLAQRAFALPAVAIAFVLFFTVFFSAGAQFAPTAIVFNLIFWSLVVFVLIRFGLLAIVALLFFDDLLERIPQTTQLSSWYWGLSLAGILSMSEVVFYGFYTSLGGRPSEAPSSRSELTSLCTTHLVISPQPPHSVLVVVPRTSSQ